MLNITEIISTEKTNNPETVFELSADIRPVYECIFSNDDGNETVRQLDLEKLAALSNKIYPDNEEAFKHLSNAAFEMLEILSSKYNNAGYYLSYEKSANDEFWVVGYKGHSFQFRRVVFSKAEAIKEAKRHYRGYYRPGYIEEEGRPLKKAYYVYGQNKKDEEKDLPVDELIGIYKDRERAEVISNFYKGSVIKRHTFKERWIIINAYTASVNQVPEAENELHALSQLYLVAKPLEWCRLVKYHNNFIK